VILPPALGRTRLGRAGLSGPVRSQRGRSLGAALLFLLCAGLAVPLPVAMAQPAPAAPTAGDSTAYASATERLNHRFAFGLALLEANQPRSAAAVFADILAHDPNLVRVRLELARAWFLSKNWGRARGEFLSVLAGRDVPAPVRANVLRFLRAIDARRGVDWDVDLALVRLGDTRRYDSDTILINGLPFTLDGRDGTTATGLRYRLGGTVAWDFPALSGAYARTLGFGHLVASGDDGPGTRFDDTTLRAEAGLRLVWPRATLALAPFVQRRFLAEQAAEDRTGFDARFRIRRPHGATWALSAGWQRIDHLQRDARDGHAATLGLTGTWAVSPRATLGLALSLADRDAESPADDALRTRLTAFGVFDAGRGLTLRPHIWAERRQVDTPGPAAADETGAGVALTVQTSRIILGNGFTPYATLSVARVRSDLAAFSYREHSILVGLERRF